MAVSDGRQLCCLLLKSCAKRRLGCSGIENDIYRPLFVAGVGKRLEPLPSVPQSLKTFAANERIPVSKFGSTLIKHVVESPISRPKNSPLQIIAKDRRKHAHDATGRQNLEGHAVARKDTIDGRSKRVLSRLLIERQMVVIEEIVMLPENRPRHRRVNEFDEIQDEQRLRRKGFPRRKKVVFSQTRCFERPGQPRHLGYHRSGQSIQVVTANGLSEMALRNWSTG